MTHENHNLADFTTDSQQDNTADETTEQAPDPNSETQEKTGDNDPDTSPDKPLCPKYPEEHTNEEWQEILDVLNANEPKCGYAIKYLRERTFSRLKESTGRNYCSSLRIFVDFLHDEGITVCDAELRDIQRFFDTRAASGRREETLAQDRSAICELYKYIALYCDAEPNVKYGLIREEITPSEYQVPDPIEREPLEKDEIKQLYDALGSFRDRLIVQVGVELGARAGDISQLKVSDVDLDEQMVRVSNQKAGGQYDLPISNELTLVLRHWIEVRRRSYYKSTNHDYLFPSQKGGGISIDRLNNIVKEAADEAGIQEVLGTVPISERQQDVMNTDKQRREINKVTFHTLRHTFNYLLAEAGVPREARSDALDHSSTEVTKKFYDHQESNYQEFITSCFNNFDLGDVSSDDDDTPAPVPSTGS